MNGTTMDFVPLPVTTPLHGFFWTWGVPVLMFVITAVATWLLPRHRRDYPHLDGVHPRLVGELQRLARPHGALHAHLLTCATSPEPTALMAASTTVDTL